MNVPNGLPVVTSPLPEAKYELKFVGRVGVLKQGEAPKSHTSCGHPQEHSNSHRRELHERGATTRDYVYRESGIVNSN